MHLGKAISVGLLYGALFIYTGLFWSSFHIYRSLLSVHLGKAISVGLSYGALFIYTGLFWVSVGLFYGALFIYTGLVWVCTLERPFPFTTQRHCSNILVYYMGLLSYIQVSFECVPREGCFSDSTQRHCSNISVSYRGLFSYIHVSFECVPREGCFSDSTQRHLSNILVAYMRLFSYIQVSFECVPREGHFLIPRNGTVPQYWSLNKALFIYAGRFWVCTSGRPFFDSTLRRGVPAWRFRASALRNCRSARQLCQDRPKD